MCSRRICEYHEKNYAAALDTLTEGQKLDSKYWNSALISRSLVCVLNTISELFGVISSNYRNPAPFFLLLMVFCVAVEFEFT